MLRQRGAETPPTRPAPVKKTQRVELQPNTESKRRLSFKEKHALETLPAHIEQVRAKLAKLHEILDDHGLYARDPKRFAEATALLAKLEAELATSEDRWLELELLREDLQG
jgi:ATP-binding cassette subfamily F protein uup